jgi:hypothetical protein
MFWRSWQHPTSRYRTPARRRLFHGPTTRRRGSVPSRDPAAIRLRDLNARYSTFIFGFRARVEEPTGSWAVRYDSGRTTAPSSARRVISPAQIPQDLAGLFFCGARFLLHEGIRNPRARVLRRPPLPRTMKKPPAPSAKLRRLLTTPCPVCGASGWVCQSHLRPMGHDGCREAGKPCRCNPEALVGWDDDWAIGRR